MPLAQLVCPHCENPVEVNVTNVTRSRACPRCSRLIILQFTTRSSRHKHRALLMEMNESLLAPAGPAVPPPATAVAPRVLQGDVRSRMRHDPEVRGSARRLLWGATVFLLLLLAVVLGNHFNWWKETVAGWERLQATLASSSSAKSPPAPGKPSKPAAPARPVPPPAGKSAVSPAWQAAEGFLAAKTVEERLAFVRDRELMESRIRAYYVSKGDGPVNHFGIKVSEEEEASAAFTVDLGGDGQRVLHVFKADDGTFKVDWASFVMYGEMAREQFLATKPRTPVLFRVLAVSDSFYNEVFTDVRRLACVKLFDPLDLSAPPIYGYTSRTSTLGRSLDYVLKKAFGQEVPLVVTLRFPDEGGTDPGNQVWIEEMVAEGWVTQGR